MLGLELKPFGVDGLLCKGVARGGESTYGLAGDVDGVKGTWLSGEGGGVAFRLMDIHANDGVEGV